MHLCGVCGKVGHNARTCPKNENAEERDIDIHDVLDLHEEGEEQNGNGGEKRHYNCRLCGEHGHNARTCPNLEEEPKKAANADGGSSDKVEIEIPVVTYKCGKCGEHGHNARTCVGKKPKKEAAGKMAPKKAEKEERKTYVCALCNESGHNARTCPNHYTCGNCGKKGHNARTCPV